MFSAVFTAKKMLNPLSIFLIVCLGAGAWAIVIFNQFVQKKNLVLEAWSGIDVQLKRRHDLIPNIVEAVKGYMQHERGLLEDIARLRTQATQAQEIKGRAAAENNLTQSLKTLFAVAENYPNLKADQHFLELQKTLTAVEDDLQLARRYYNGTVREFNILTQSFPSNLLAAVFHFKNFEFFELESVAERQVPDIKI